MKQESKTIADLIAYLYYDGRYTNRQVAGIARQFAVEIS
jgi:hypothetical protein